MLSWCIEEKRPFSRWVRVRVNLSLQDLVVVFGVVSIPGSEVPHQATLDGAVVEIPLFLYLKNTWNLLKHLR